MARIHTIADYQPYHVDASRRIKARYCPGMRPCWSFNYTSYNPFRRPTHADTLRRVCMIVTLAACTLIDLLKLYYAIVSFDVLESVIRLILALIGFFFVGWCLATIGDAEGQRIVLGREIGRWHLDAFLLVCALVHTALLGGYFFGLWSGVLGIGLETARILMWILIFAVAWVATWGPNGLSLA